MIEIKILANLLGCILTVYLIYKWKTKTKNKEIKEKKPVALAQKKIETMQDIISIFRDLMTLEKEEANTLAQKIVDIFLNNKKSWVQNSLQSKYVSLTSEKLYYKKDTERQEIIDLVINKLKTFDDDQAIHLLGIVSFNAYGYFREAAITALSNYKNPMIIPYLLMRTTDWVGIVQKKSIQIIEDSFQYFTALEYLKHYYLINRIISFKDNIDYYSWESGNIYDVMEIDDEHYKCKKQYIFQKLCLFIKDKENRSIMFDYFKKASMKEVLFFYKINKDILFEDKQFSDFAMSVKFHEVTLFYLEEGINQKIFNSDILKFLNSKTVNIRYLTLKSIPIDVRKDYRDIFEKALLDPSFKIRDFSRFVIKQLNGVGLFEKDLTIYPFYKEVFERDSSNIWGIIGMIENTPKEDIDKIYPFLYYQNKNVKLAAFKALDHFRIHDAEFYLEAIKDSSSKIRSIGAKVLKDHLNVVTNELIALLYKSLPNIQITILSLLFHMPRDKFLPVFLEFLSSSPSPEASDCAWKLFHKKYLASYFSPYTSPHSTDVANIKYSFSNVTKDEFSKIFLLFEKLNKNKTEKSEENMKKITTYIDVLKKIREESFK